MVVVGPGFVVVQPNESRVLILFGRYVGTLIEARLWWVNPFTVFWRKRISLRVRNFQSERIKVNDSSGKPIEIAAVVVCRVVDTAYAVFDVEDFEQFVTVQSETALRHLASEYPCDDYSQERISLRGNADEVRDGLQAELQTRLQTAGIEVLETRLTHLACAPEIAEVMLRRQQAEAILAERGRHVREQAFPAPTEPSPVRGAAPLGRRRSAQHQRPDRVPAHGPGAPRRPPTRSAQPTSPGPEYTRRRRGSGLGEPRLSRAG
jgi:regulator of protease activity HflC (stomatin/prohibitin superfamily)